MGLISFFNLTSNQINWGCLALAILFEVLATSSLKISDNFTRPLPSLFVVIGYASCYYFLSLCLRTVPIGIAYAIWSGVGLFLVSIIGFYYYEQRLNTPALIGMVFIIIGVIILNLYGGTE
jgi:small multidrug resistance pump